jgi:hypothetical protein
MSIFGSWSTYKLNNTITQFLLSCYKGVTKSFWIGHLEWELQMVQLFATRCSCMAILWVNLVSFAAITLWVASQWVFIVVVYFVINSVWKLLDTSSYLWVVWTLWAHENATLCQFILIFHVTVQIRKFCNDEYWMIGWLWMMNLESCERKIIIV